MPDRITRTYWLRWPRWRTRAEAGPNWRLFRGLDFVLLVVALTGVLGSGIGLSLVAGWYMLGMPVVIWRRCLRRRHQDCAARGHHPYKPNPEVDEWACEWCAMPLSVHDPRWVATSVAQAASDFRSAQRVSQARYSDRR